MHYAIGNKYPIETKEQVKIAEDYFTKYLTRIDPADRVAVASRLEKRASELSVELDSDWIINYSRMTKIGKLISPTFEWNLEMRKEASSDSINIDGIEISSENALQKIAKLKGEGANGDLLVEVISEFDKAAGLVDKYDNSIVDPILTVYGNLANPRFDAVKVAEGVTDYDLTRASNNEEVLTKIAEVFGDDMSSRFSDTPMTTLLSVDGPELDLFTSIISN